MARYLVRASLLVEVEIPDDADPTFAIEENGCPGTGVVFLAIKDYVEREEESGVCLACVTGMTNEVVRRLDTAEKSP